MLLLIVLLSVIIPNRSAKHTPTLAEHSNDPARLMYAPVSLNASDVSRFLGFSAQSQPSNEKCDN
jgi:hypothetical protein